MFRRIRQAGATWKVRRLPWSLLNLGQIVGFIGGTLFAGWLDSHGPQGSLGTALLVPTWLIIIASFLASIFLTDASFVGLLSCVALMCGGGVAYQVFPQSAIEERGEHGSCVVLNVDERVASSGGAGAGTDDMITHTTHTTYYEHRLDCSIGRVLTLTTTDSPAGSPGSRIRVVYDPAGRVEPMMPEDDVSPQTLLVVTLVATSAAIVLAPDRAPRPPLFPSVPLR